jgi:hypothetical protein
MSKLKSRLLVVIFAVGLLTILLSCSQTDDITAPKSLTKIWLSVERLPTPPVGMIYGLWASKVAYPSISQTSQVQYIGQFSYMTSDTLITFLDENNAVRADSNEFSFEGDLFSYDYLFITVENDTAEINLPGPVMLTQRVTGNTDTIRMFFPQQDSLWESIIRCNFETPTDNNAWNDGYGLWFCNHERIRLVITDTFSVDVSYKWDTIQAVTNAKPGDTVWDTLNFASLYGEYADTVWYEYDTTLLNFGRDTLALGINGYVHYGATQQAIRVVDSTIPRIRKDYNADTTATDTTGLYAHVNVDTIFLDIFSQDLYAMPDLSPYGWKYKGWVVSTNIPTGAIGKFTPPAYDFTTGEVLIPGYTGGLLTTGTFTDETDYDNSDPYTLYVPWEVDSGTFIDTVAKRPRFPGEDFLDTAAMRAALHGYPSLGWLGAPVAWSPGTIFISVEPDNMITDTTNFPLIPFYRGLNGIYDVYTLMNMSGVADGSKGFPKAEARIKRY